MQTTRSLALALATLCALGSCKSNTTAPANDVAADLIVRNLLNVPVSVVVDIPNAVSANLPVQTCQVLPLEVPVGKADLVAVTDSGGATTSYSVDFSAVAVWSLAVGSGGPVALGQVSPTC